MSHYRPLKHRVVHAVLMQYIHAGGAVYLRVVAPVALLLIKVVQKAGDAPILYVLRRKALGQAPHYGFNCHGMLNVVLALHVLVQKLVCLFSVHSHSPP